MQMRDGPYDGDFIWKDTGETAASRTTRHDRASNHRIRAERGHRCVIPASANQKLARREAHPIGDESANAISRNGSVSFADAFRHRSAGE